MSFNDTFIIRDLTRCDSSLRRGSGPSPCPKASTTANTIHSAFQGKVAPFSATGEEMHLREARARTPWRAESWQRGLPVSQSGWLTMS